MRKIGFSRSCCKWNPWSRALSLCRISWWASFSFETKLTTRNLPLTVVENASPSREWREQLRGKNGLDKVTFSWNSFFFIFIFVQKEKIDGGIVHKTELRSIFSIIRICEERTIFEKFVFYIFVQKEKVDSGIVHNTEPRWCSFWMRFLSSMEE